MSKQEVRFTYWRMRARGYPLANQYTVKANGVEVGYIRQIGGRWLVGDGRGGWEGPMPTRVSAARLLVQHWAKREAATLGGTPTQRLSELIGAR